MRQGEFEGRWERLGGTVQSKWGKRTRLERSAAAARRLAPDDPVDEASDLREKGGAAPEKRRPWKH